MIERIETGGYVALHKPGSSYPLVVHLRESGVTSSVWAEAVGMVAELAHWAKLRTHELSQLFHLKREKMPHYSTWSRVLGHAVEPSEVEHLLGQFFAAAARRAEPQRGSIRLALDGKTLRGTIPRGETQGVHLLAAYLPNQGVVLAQLRGDREKQ